jgi:hypothetical protein
MSMTNHEVLNPMLLEYAPKFKYRIQDVKPMYLKQIFNFVAKYKRISVCVEATHYQVQKNWNTLNQFVCTVIPEKFMFFYKFFFLISDSLICLLMIVLFLWINNPTIDFNLHFCKTGVLSHGFCYILFECFSSKMIEHSPSIMELKTALTQEQECYMFVLPEVAGSSGSSSEL